MALTTVDYDGKFRYDLATKQVTFTDTTDYAGQGVSKANVTVVIKAETAGGGIFYNNTNHSVPDIDPDVSLDSTIVIPLPLDGSGNPLQDTYTFTLEWEDTTAAPYTISKAKSQALSYSSPSVDISMDVDCITPRLTATDDTDYTVGGINPTIVRAFAIHYPPSTPTADVTGTGSSVYTATFYTVANSTVEHSSSLTSTLTYDLTNGIYIEDSVTGSKVVEVSCDGDLCDIYCCIRSLWERYDAAKGNNNVLAVKELEKFHKVTSLAEMVGTALKCGKSTHISDYVTEILKISECDAGCSCNDGTPQLVTGLGAGNSDVTVAAGTGVSVNLAGSEYTVSLSSENINKLASTYNTVVAAGTNISSVTSSSVTAGDVTTTTYTVNATDTVIESLFIEATITFPVGGTPTSVLNAKKLYGTTFTDAVTDGGGILPFLDVENDGSVTDWQQNYNSIIVQNFFSGGSTDYFPEVASVEEITWNKGGRDGTTSSTNDPAFRVQIYDKNANDFKIRFAKGTRLLGSDVENRLSSVKLIFKIHA